MQINNIQRPQALQAGRALKVIHGPFHAKINRSTFTLDLYLQDMYVRSFKVGLGKPGFETPTGRWRVQEHGKLVKPPWTDPDTGRLYKSTDPDYPLGSRWIGLEGIDIALAAKTKASVLRELVSLAERTGLVYDARGLLEALEARESLCSTALPNGVAIPHPRQPMPYVSAEPLVCIGRVPAGIGFGSTYGDLSYLFFLVCCHEDRHHLRVLARLMRVLDGDTIGKLRETESAEELLQVLIVKEKEVVAQTG
jgi:mannitol/fructose-specific phosphotransferase system IIA component (Ntr-type)